MNFGDFEALSQFRTQDVQQDKDTTTQLQFDKDTSSLYRSLLQSFLQLLLQVNDPLSGVRKVHRKHLFAKSPRLWLDLTDKGE